MQLAYLVGSFVHRYQVYCSRHEYNTQHVNGSLMTLHDFTQKLLTTESTNNVDFASDQGGLDDANVTIKLLIADLGVELRLRNVDSLRTMCEDPQTPINDCYETLRSLAASEHKGTHLLMAPSYLSVLKRVKPSPCNPDDAHSRLRQQQASTRCRIRYEERVASAVGGDGVVNVGSGRIRVRNRQVQSDKRAREGSGLQHEFDPLLTARDVDVAYMAVVYGLYVHDLFAFVRTSTTTGVDLSPVVLADFLPDAVIETYAQAYMYGALSSVSDNRGAEV